MYVEIIKKRRLIMFAPRKIFLATMLEIEYRLNVLCIISFYFFLIDLININGFFFLFFLHSFNCM